MQNQMTFDEVSVLDPDEVEEEEVVESGPAWASDEDSEFPFDDLNPYWARKTLIESQNRIIQNKNAARIRQYKVELKEWEKFILDEKNDGKFKPRPEFPMLRKTLNSRQLDQAVFMARQRGNFVLLLEKAGYRAKK